jgi:hypothetical protein
MRVYKVQGAIVQISPGTELIISGEQLRRRRHQTRVIKKVSKDGDMLVEATGMLTFKVGEMIGLAAVPAQAVAHLLDMQAGMSAADLAPNERTANRQSAAEKKRIAARDKAVEAAHAAFAGSADLQKKYASADAYVAALDAERAA